MLIDALNNPLAVVVLAYFALAGLLAILLHPMRRKMVDLAEGILADPRWTERDRTEINLLLDTCMSFRVGFMVPLAVISVFTDLMFDRRGPADRTRLDSDPRYDALVWRYFFSIIAANPVVAPITVLSTVLGMAFKAFAPDLDLRALMEELMRRASGAVASEYRFA